MPFVRRCTLDFDDGSATTAFLVNISVVGAYVAPDELPRLGQRVSCRFRLPDSELDLEVFGVVAWLNPRQQHPVHSLPPGFGLRFERLSAEHRQRIEGIVLEYVARTKRIG